MPVYDPELLWTMGKLTFGLRVCVCAQSQPIESVCPTWPIHDSPRLVMTKPHQRIILIWGTRIIKRANAQRQEPFSSHERQSSVLLP